MCACDEGRKCAAHRVLPDYRCDDYPELLDWREADLTALGAGGAREASEDANHD